MHAFCINVPVGDQKKMDEFNDLMSKYGESFNRHIEEESVRLGVSEQAAGDIIYLRSRSRWTQEKEDYLIWLDKNGKQLPNIMEDFEPK